MSNPDSKRKLKWWQIAVWIPLSPFVLVGLCILIPLVLVLYFVYSISLHIVIWLWWNLRGRDILFVYSDSPIWHDYIEQQILPLLSQRAIVLNWSQRKRWRFSLAKMAFRHFGNYREFNPLAVVFRPFRRRRIFRFWQPFRDFKHGNPETLLKMESEFFGLIGIQKPH
jgi:hypothetical protein